MKKIAISVLTFFAIGLSGCIVAPVQPAYVGPPIAPAGVIYVAPTYVAPGPGFIWSHHARFGWGWHHPQHGWHKGWR